MARKDAPWTVNDLDKKVYISLPNNTVDAGSKIVIKGWLSEVQVYANVLEIPASKEKEILSGLVYNRIIDVVIRYKSDYDSTLNKLKYKDLDYDIIEAREVYGRIRWLKLKCVYGGKEYNR